ncbi:MAG: FecR domain-containing protein [Cytophagaceae bacterium]|nr:FecR domain-containing protein [Cytophagaceae bacterium]
MNHYSGYQAEDFAADDAFIVWVLDPTPERSARWQDWLTAHPEKVAVVGEARKLVHSLRFEAELPSTDAMNAMWTTISARRQPQLGRVLAFGPVAWRVAAAVAVFVLAGIGGWYGLMQRQTEIRTAYGETRTVALPDGSIVSLNGNTSLRFASHWDNQNTREVWLDGEAFFEIQKKPLQGAYARFVAHAGSTDLIVLGTKFNLRHRRNEIQVILAEGKVQLHNSAGKTLTMKPGEVAVARASAPPQLLPTVRPERYLAWTEQRLVFDATPLGDIARMLEDTYGLTIKFDDPALKQLQLQGTVFVKNADDIVDAVAASFDLTYERQENTIRFRRP